jgi:hypothetical protein
MIHSKEEKHTRKRRQSKLHHINTFNMHLTILNVQTRYYFTPTIHKATNNKSPHISIKHTNIEENTVKHIMEIIPIILYFILFYQSIF